MNDSHELGYVGDYPIFGQIAGLINGFARDIAYCINEVPGGLARAIKAINEAEDGQEAA